MSKYSSFFVYLYFLFITFYKKMDSSIAIVVPSMKTDEEKELLINNIEETCGCEYVVLFVDNYYNNQLSYVFNQLLSSKEVDDEIFVFLKDDVRFLKSGWGNEIIRLFKENKKYGIIGVLGSSFFDEDGAWWTYEEKYGQILYSSKGEDTLLMYSDLLDTDLKPVCVIDDVFIAINKKRVKDKFDEDINGTTLYNVGLCLSNIINHNVKIGVTTNIRMKYTTPRVITDEWYENRNIINNKYKNYFPIVV